MEHIDLINFTSMLGSKIPCYIVSSNELNERKFPKRCVIISNTDPSWKPGSHWVAFSLNPDMPVQFFDSLGRKVTDYSTYFVKFLKLYNNNFFYLSNQFAIQSNSSNICGLYCLLYYWSKVRNISLVKLMHIFSNMHKLENDQKCLELIQKIYNFNFSLM